nr:hypothetical protein [Tanacetum cinerariifolium]
MSSVKNHVSNLSKSEELSNIGHECDVPICDDFTTFSNLLFDAGDNFSSSDDKSFSDEDIDSLLDEFVDKLIFLKSIPVECDPEEEIRLIEKLLYDYSSPRPLEEFNSKNSDAIIESFSPSPIPVKDSNSLVEEIDLSLTLDDSLPQDIKNDDYDSERDILIPEELHSNDSLLLPENESFHFDIPIYYDDDNDEESSTLLRDIIISELPSCIAITHVLSTKEPKNSLIMGDEHLDIIPEKESDEFIMSSVKNHVSNLSKSEELSNIGHECDIDSLLDEFVDKLIFLKSIPVECDPEEEIHLIEKLLYDYSSPRPLEEFNSKNFDAIIESFSPSPIPVKNSNSLVEEIDLSLTLDDSLPQDIENDYYDSKRDILIPEELHSNDSLLLPENESFHFDVPSSPRPPAKPPNDDEIKPDMGILTVKVVGDISEHYVLMPRLLPNQPTLTSNEEKSPHLLYHRGFKAF